TRQTNQPLQAESVETVRSVLNQLPMAVLRQGSEVHSLVKLADGRLASGGDDGTIKLWVVDEHKLIAALCLCAGHNLTKDEWNRYIGSDSPWQPSCRDLPSNWQGNIPPLPLPSRLSRWTQSLNVRLDHLAGFSTAVDASPRKNVQVYNPGRVLTGHAD